MRINRRMVIASIPLSLLFASSLHAAPKSSWDGTWSGSWGGKNPTSSNDRRQLGRKLRIPRRVHAGGKEQSDAEKRHLPRQRDHREAHKNQQHDGIGDVAQFAGRRDCQTDKAVTRLHSFLPGGYNATVH